MPPDDHTAIELLFAHDPVPLRTHGNVVHRIREAFGAPPTLVCWRLADADH